MREQTEAYRDGDTQCGGTGPFRTCRKSWSRPGGRSPLGASEGSDLMYKEDPW